MVYIWSKSMGRLKKKKKSLPCDPDIGPSAFATLAIHTCLIQRNYRKYKSVKKNNRIIPATDKLCNLPFSVTHYILLWSVLTLCKYWVLGYILFNIWWLTRACQHIYRYSPFRVQTRIGLIVVFVVEREEGRVNPNIKSYHLTEPRTLGKVGKQYQLLVRLSPQFDNMIICASR